MSTWAILATGPSMSPSVVDVVRAAAIRAVAVGSAWRLAPWADALASSDAAWWEAHPGALKFAGRKFTAAYSHEGIADVERIRGAARESNSGLLGMMAAVSMGARRLLLLGFDLHGAHFFGQHQPPLKNPGPQQFRVFASQFNRYHPRGVEIINCTPGSALDCYPKAALEIALRNGHE